MVGDATLCSLPHAACASWSGGRFIPAREASPCSAAATVSLALLTLSLFRRSVITASRAEHLSSALHLAFDMPGGLAIGALAFLCFSWVELAAAA